MKNFLNFLNSSAGLLILGFLLTTGLGALLNLVIQNGKSQNERGFEMYKTRLAEAKTLQANLLEQSTARFFYLEQILGRLDEDPPEKTRKYWEKNYSAVKDDWNKKVVNFHAQMRILFTENLPSLLFSDYEDPITTNGLVRRNLQYMINKDEYEKNTPKTIHGAFVDAHATIYHMVFICQKTIENDCKEWENLMNLAHRQMVYLKLLHSCLSYGISAQLLVDPYGPQKESRTPKQCDDVFTKAARQDNQSAQKFGPRQYTSKTED